jgi:periplasmic divalent cation tolerance protein
MTSEHCLVLSACPDSEVAHQLANMLVERRLAACINILPGVTSIYRWKDVIETSQECHLLIKTTRTNYQPLEAAIRENHPYELPEIVMVPVDHGLPAYLQWINQCVKPVI